MNATEPTPEEEFTAMIRRAMRTVSKPPPPDVARHRVLHDLAAQRGLGESRRGDDAQLG